MKTSNAEIDFLKFDEYFTLVKSLRRNVLFQSLIEKLVFKRNYFEHIDSAEPVEEIAMCIYAL